MKVSTNAFDTAAPPQATETPVFSSSSRSEVSTRPGLVVDIRVDPQTRLTLFSLTICRTFSLGTSLPISMTVYPLAFRIAAQMFFPMSCKSPAATKDAMTPLLGTAPILSWQIFMPACMASLDIRISGTNDSPRSYISHCTVMPGIRALVTMSTGSLPFSICSFTLGSTMALLPSRTAWEISRYAASLGKNSALRLSRFFSFLSLGLMIPSSMAMPSLTSLLNLTGSSRRIFSTFCIAMSICIGTHLLRPCTRRGS